MTSNDETFTPSKALQLQKPTENFLCSTTNAYGILFESFVISNPNNDILFAIGTADDEIIKRSIGSMCFDYDMDVENDQDVYRKIKYSFPANVLSEYTIESKAFANNRQLKINLHFTNNRLNRFTGENRVSSILTFSTYHPLKNFRIIERHYFRSRLIKSYDFTFGFCIPNSTNTWETLLDVPILDAKLVKEMIEHPYETKSDTFYFVGDELVMHNKASYHFFDNRREFSSCKTHDVKDDLSKLTLHK